MYRSLEALQAENRKKKVSKKSSRAFQWHFWVTFLWDVSTFFGPGRLFCDFFLRFSAWREKGKSLHSQHSNRTREDNRILGLLQELLGLSIPRYHAPLQDLHRSTLYQTCDTHATLLCQRPDILQIRDMFWMSWAKVWATNGIKLCVEARASQVALKTPTYVCCMAGKQASN